MPKTSHMPARGEDPSEDRLARLEEENRTLRSDLDALRASLSAEVRTRRLVVEEEDGFERVVAEGHGEHGTLTVYARPVDRERAAEGAVEGDGAEVVLIGNDESIAPSASVYVRATPDGFGSLGIAGRWSAERAKTGPRSSIHLDSPLGQAGIEIDSDGLKNAPMRLYLEREAVKEERRTG